MALGEHVDHVHEHLHECPTCSSEVRALSAAASTARRADLSALAPPPPSVWDRIAGELGLEEPTVPDVAVTPLRPSRRRRVLTAAAGATAVAAAAALFLTVGSPFGGTTSGEGPSVPLQALGDTQATGRVVLAASPEQRSLLVDTVGLPRPDGYYEVWLLDVEDDRLVALGTLDESGRGWLDVPEGVEMSDYPYVDVSLEPDDGNPQHSGDSVLRADLPTLS
jgi:hypothetical protein